ncbi:putative Glutathione S-transferase [Taphrina deformans PYCC 5710]|uniref:Glutathione S-transferase n=1 Tax=Taphrina deformans (strain PYCC 5710 / ATCC 11124 / CBS 356.35 / IMI 108563 / JCM 9778 / NBRC 8474) TaxID=1097556 RepID=R4XAM9_TAPDE|nr:putative Glutathione S-transferase [Taphrina deformans PYCC 5710]|eukprot:CCG82853.1 putative Glutathione S-transferase [Taphrina deformans PYCC 5710]
MTITLYSSIKCPWAARAWLALIEAGLDFELVEIDLSVPREPWYLEQINPVGKVPAIKWHDGTIICESSVCAEFVADHTGKLFPRDAISRSKVRFFIETFTAKFPPALYGALGGPPQKQKERLLEAVSTVEGLLKTFYKGGPFLLGSKEYTLAEVDCVPFMARFDMAGRHGLYNGTVYQDIRTDSKYKLFNEYLDNCLSRPSHVKIWDDEANSQAAKARLKSNKSSPDYIFLEELRLVGKVGLSAFSFAERSFPITISASVMTKPVQAGSDEYAISYGDVCREITKIVEQNSFKGLEDLASVILQAPSTVGAWRELVVQKEGGILRAEKEIFELDIASNAKSSIKGLTLGCIIGIYDHEREKKQDVIIDLSIKLGNWSASTNKSRFAEVEDQKRKLVEAVVAYVEKSDFKTVEALAQKISEVSFDVLPSSIEEIEVWISKPSALTFAKQSGVCITRRQGN